jgi:hypothetical protein
MVMANSKKCRSNSEPRRNSQCSVQADAGRLVAIVEGQLRRNAIDHGQPKASKLDSLKQLDFNSRGKIHPSDPAPLHSRAQQQSASQPRVEASGDEPCGGPMSALDPDAAARHDIQARRDFVMFPDGQYNSRRSDIEQWLSNVSSNAIDENLEMLDITQHGRRAVPSEQEIEPEEKLQPDEEKLQPRPSSSGDTVPMPHPQKNQEPGRKDAQQR